LHKENIKIICNLCPIVSPIGHYIVPIVGLIVDSQNEKNDVCEIIDNLKPNSDEVEFIFWIPLNYFSSPDALFNQILSPLEYNFKIDTSLNEVYPNHIIRNFFTISKEYFILNQIGNNSKQIIRNQPKNPYVYGVNAHLTMICYLLCIENSKFDCTIEGRIDDTNVAKYVHDLTISAYIAFKIDYHKRNSKIYSKI
jgi:hypothetical protein